MGVVQRSGGRVRAAQVDRDLVVTTPKAAPAFEQRKGGGAHRSRHRRRRRWQIPSGLLSHGGWSLVVATTGVSGLNFLFHVLISRLLGPPQYGAFTAVLNIISVLAVPLGAVQLAVTQSVVSGAGRGRVSLRSLTMKATLWGVGAMVVSEALVTADEQLPEPELTLREPGHGGLDPRRGGRRGPAGGAARRAALRARRRGHVPRRRRAPAGQRRPARLGRVRGGGRGGGDGDRPGVHDRGPAPDRAQGGIREGGSTRC